MSAMTLISHPALGGCPGEMTVPGDKSISHRAILLGAIAVGPTYIEGLLEGDDCLATLRAIQALGVVVERMGVGSWLIHGVGKYGLLPPQKEIDCGNSGTTMRLLSGILAAQPFDSLLTGDDSLLKRPMERVAHPLRQMGALIETRDGRAPCRFRGVSLLHGRVYSMPNASAQVKSALLLAGLYAEGETSVIEPAVTRDHTERLLRMFSYPLSITDSCITLTSAHELMGTTIRVPGDLSSAAFFIVAASIIPNAQIVITDVGINPSRMGLISLLQQMGADITINHQRYYGEEPVADLMVKQAPLHGITITPDSVSLAIDEFPVLFIAASVAKGRTVLQGAEELRVKESDRIATMTAGLQKIGICISATEDGVVIDGGILEGGIVDAKRDHRVAMAFCIAGAVAKKPIIVCGCDTITTSFPGFLKAANDMNLLITEG